MPKRIYKHPIITHQIFRKLFCSLLTNLFVMCLRFFHITTDHFQFPNPKTFRDLTPNDYDLYELIINPWLPLLKPF